jgi:glycerol-3-phosphate dehydrogenase
MMATRLTLSRFGRLSLSNCLSSCSTNSERGSENFAREGAGSALFGARRLLRMVSDETDFDVIVIGAGINGAGIARDAAMRGLKVLLLDKGDIGGGTSSWSTRLIHGGLRYLEHGEFRLVRESLRERECLLRIAPHLVRPLQLLVPIYQHARRGLWTVRAGMIIYDLLSSGKTLPAHRILSPRETLEKEPELNREGLIGAAVYYDAQVEFAERLVVENVISAVEHGATVLTYALVEKLIIQDGAVSGVEYTRVQNALSNDRGVSSRKARSAKGRIVINATGPWVDQLLERTNTGYSPQLIGGTKGSHIIVAPFAGAPETAIYVEAETDRRPFFIIPWNLKYLIGTTDIRYQGDLDLVGIEGDEVEYLLRETNRVIPQAKLSREHILFTYSGVRPLPFTGDKDEQSITRQHFIRAHQQIANLYSVVGGKLTTYRSLAEQVVHLIFNRLSRPSTECLTARQPLPGAATTQDFNTFCADFRQRSGLSETISDRLLRIYGTRASLILDLVKEDKALGRVFDSETGAIAAEVVFTFKYEFATTLADCLLRRTMVGLNSSCGLNAIEAAGQIVQSHLGWGGDRVMQQTAEYRNQISQRFNRR